MGKKSRSKKRSQRPSPRARPPRRLSSRRLPALAAAGLILLLIAGTWAWVRSRRDEQQDAVAATVQAVQAQIAAQTASAPTSEPTLPPNIGPVTGCVHRPAFVSRLNLGDRILIGTNLKGYTGLTLSAQQSDGRVAVYQHPTWDDAGHLAAYALDKDGNIYVAPAPFVSLENNPLEEQNNIYKIDTNTGVMSLFIKLPWAQPPNTTNPYGVMGLTYDCDTHSLYASSVAGSTYDEEMGRIFQIDLAAVSIVSQLEGIDAFGLGVYRGVLGKRLYFGSARNSSIRSVALDETGALNAEQRLEFRLLQAPGGQDERAKKIQFPKRDEMLIKAIQFNYTLRAASDFQQHNYTYRYVPAKDVWEFVQVRLHSGVE
ncbi:MAG TPA: hypothetical protein ENK60_03985 [Anaerolineae bacterium]|nr:hypothetical protein [Anaerolineae bacterium]